MWYRIIEKQLENGKNPLGDYCTGGIRVKKKLTLLLATMMVLVAALALTGCPAGSGGEKSSTSGTPYEQYMTAAKALANAKGYSMDTDVDMSLEIMGQKMDIPIKGSILYSRKSDTDVQMKTVQKTTILGQEMEIISYFKDGYLYTETLGTKTKMESPLSSVMATSSAPEFAKGAIKDSSSKKGEGGTEMSFTVDGSAMKDIVTKNMSGMGEMISADDMVFGDAKIVTTINGEEIVNFSMKITFEMTIQEQKTDCTMTLKMQNIKMGDQSIEYPNDLDSYQAAATGTK
jgi:hypothetical protein